MPIDDEPVADDHVPEDDAVEAADESLPEAEHDGEIAAEHDAEVDEPAAEDFELDTDPVPNDDAALIERARRRYGTAGAIVAGGMLGLEKILQPKVKQEAPVEWEAPGEPHDIDRTGITVPLDDDAVVRSRPGPPAAPGASARKVTRRRRA